MNLSYFGKFEWTKSGLRYLFGKERFQNILRDYIIKAM